MNTNSFDEWWNNTWGLEVQLSSRIKNACRFAFNDAFLAGQKSILDRKCKDCEHFDTKSFVDDYGGECTHDGCEIIFRNDFSCKYWQAAK